MRHIQNSVAMDTIVEDLNNHIRDQIVMKKIYPSGWQESILRWYHIINHLEITTHISLLIFFQFWKNIKCLSNIWMCEYFPLSLSLHFEYSQMFWSLSDLYFSQTAKGMIEWLNGWPCGIFHLCILNAWLFLMGGLFTER